ncbi:hypothetical protein GALMADRAFT_246668 [Galerina marginata CBS 339.88]|uniref:Uncharacterized protein n=1 Tax=Galerina marginata (strain CBS 339.88) TaxID=685588 RepID=A0A067T4N4_GALM3|nr:hypothetical protein GALMADRAFT_246668 [Galerina marginata CBS 339.88]
MPALPSFITYKPGRRTKAAIKSPFSLLRGEPSTSFIPPPVPPLPPSYVHAEVIDINDQGPRYSLDFDGGKPIDESEKNLVDEEPRYKRPDPSASPQVQLDIDVSPEALTDWFAANFLSEPFTEAPTASTSGLRNEISNASAAGGLAGLNGSGGRITADDDAESHYSTSSEDVIANLQAMNPSHFGKMPGYDNFNRLDQTSPKKPSPNPITIPAGSPRAQNGQATKPADNSLAYRLSRPLSALDTPASSAVSGTTLARALMSNTFVLSNDNRSSRYRSGSVGLTRSDSTTLPRAEHSFGAAYNNDRFSIGPDAPAMPPNAEFLYEPPKKLRTQAELKEKRLQYLKRRSSTGSLSTKNLPDTPSIISNRPTSTLLSPGAEFDINAFLPKTPESRKAPSLPRSPLPPTPKLPYSAGDDQSSFTQPSITQETEAPPEGYQEAIQRFPLDSQLLSPDLGLLSPTTSSEGAPQSGKDLDGVLNYYSLPDSPEPLVAGANYRPAFSPISEESSSQLSPPAPYRNDKRESSQRSTPVGARTPLSGSLRILPRTPSDPRNFLRQPALLPVGERPRSVTQAPAPQVPGPSSPKSASSFGSAGSDLLAPPPVSSIFNRQRAGSAPSPIKVVRDSRDANAYKITVTPQISESDTPTTEEGEVVVSQEFPETPNAFSPLLTTGSDGSPVAGQSLDGHEFLPMASVPLSAALPGRGSSQPSLAQQLLLNRAGTTVRHSRQTSIGKIKTNGLGGRSGSPSNRRITNIAELVVDNSSGSTSKPELTVDAPTPEEPALAEEVLSQSPEEFSAPGPSNLVSSTDLSRSPSRGTVLTQASDASSSSMYTSSPASETSSRTRMKALPAIPVSPFVQSPIPSAASSAPSSTPSVSSASPARPPLPPAPSAASSFASNIPPPPAIPPPSPTPSQKFRAPPVRGRLPPALTITNSTASVAEHTVAVNGTDTNGESSPTSFTQRDLEIPAVPTAPPPVPETTPAPSQSTLRYKHDDFSGRSSDIFRGTSLGSPPPYYTVVSQAIDQHDATPNSSFFSQAQASSANTAVYGAPSAALAGPSTSTDWNNSFDRGPLVRENSTMSQRSRMRPPLPAGPRRPSQMMGNFPQRDRNGSISSINSSTNNLLMQGARATPMVSPKFQTPAPKWRGYTMEAAKWTFTSAQLQAIVSRAIRQSAEASSIRLLRLEVLDNEIPEEVRRLEAQRTDLKTRYKVLTRRRANVFESMSSYLSGAEEENPAYALRLVEDLRESAITLDRLTEELHSLDSQLAHLDTLTHIHTGSALAMALRKLNSSFLKQVSENQVLRAQIQALEAERDEAWRQAECVANEYDRMNESASSKRSSRVSAVRKSSLRASKAGLRTPSQRLSQISSRGSSMYFGLAPSSARSPLLRLERIPPVPPIPRRRTLDIPSDSPLKSSAALSLNGVTPTSETLALAQAQDELYAMLGLTNPERSLRRSLSFSMPSEQSPSGTAGHGPLLSPNRLPGRNNSWQHSRRSSLPGDTALAETYNAMAADRNAMLATIDMLSATD